MDISELLLIFVTAVVKLLCAHRFHLQVLFDCSITIYVKDLLLLLLLFASN